MATFTMTLLDVLDAGEPIWDTAENGGRPYPIFDEVYRADLNQKIEDHYALREIGTETIGHFRFMLNRKMREIMPYLNQLYASEKLVDVADALTTMNVGTTGQQTGTESNTTHSTNTNTSNTDSDSRAVTSETPQTRLAGDEDYATGATDAKSLTNTTGSGVGDAQQTGQSSGTMTNTVKGSQGHTAALLMQYRASFLNIDMMVIRELEPLFMGIWDTGDEHFAHRNGLGGWYGWRAGWTPGF